MFSPGYEGTDHMFWFFYKIIIFCLKEKDIQIKAHVYSLFFSQLGDSQSYCSRHFCAVHSAMKTPVDQTKCMYYPNYYIIILKVVQSIAKARVSLFSQDSLCKL